MNQSIPYGRQNITQEDIQAVTEALQDDFLTQGPRIAAFESAFADYVGSKYAIAVSNGTAALHLSALALGVNKGDKVITSPITFSASANCVLYAGGEVDFVDIDRETFLIDLNKLEEKLKNAKKGEFKGIIPVDFAGLSVDLEEVKSLADRYELWVLEDACHAPGGTFENSNGEVVKCGSGKYSDAAIFSFHPVKHIAAGEGGMITTNDKVLADKVKMLRTHGITKEIDVLLENHGGWYYEMQELGFNYRLTDIQAALALSQLQRADQGVEIRQIIAQKYDVAFADCTAIQTPVHKTGYLNAYHLYVIQVEDRKGLYDYLRTNGIYTQVHYIPVHLLPYYKQLGWKKGDFPVAEKYYEHCLSLPMFPSLKEEEQNYVIEKIYKFINNA